MHGPLNHSQSNKKLKRISLIFLLNYLIIWTFFNWFECRKPCYFVTKGIHTCCGNNEYKSRSILSFFLYLSQWGLFLWNPCIYDTMLMYLQNTSRNRKAELQNIVPRSQHNKHVPVINSMKFENRAVASAKWKLKRSRIM